MRESQIRTFPYRVRSIPRPQRRFSSGCGTHPGAGLLLGPGAQKQALKRLTRRCADRLPIFNDSPCLDFPQGMLGHSGVAQNDYWPRDMRKPESFRNQTPRPKSVPKNCAQKLCPKSVPKICAQNPLPKSATGMSDNCLCLDAKIGKIGSQAKLANAYILSCPI